MVDRVEWLVHLLQRLYVLNRINKSEHLRLSRLDKEQLEEVRGEVQDTRRKLGGSEKRRLDARLVELGMEKMDEAKS